MGEAWVSFFWGAVLLFGLAIISAASLKGCQSNNDRFKTCIEYHSPLECERARP